MCTFEYLIISSFYIYKLTKKKKKLAINLILKYVLDIILSEIIGYL